MSGNQKTSDRVSTTLAGLRPGQSGVIDSVLPGSVVRGRLMELGFVAGTEVRVVRLAPFGDPMEVELLGYNISLRRSEAQDIVLRAR